MNIRDLLLRVSTPIQKLMQKIHPPYAQTTVKQAEDVMILMRQGDILLSREAWHFTNLFIPGFWSHAAIYGDGQVVESVAPSVQIVDWKDWVIEKHNWCILRPMDETPETGEEVFKYAKTLRGRLYDYVFEKNNSAFFCSELVYEAWETCSKWAGDVFTKRKTFGQWTVTPDDFYNAALRNKIRIVYEHRDT